MDCKSRKEQDEAQYKCWVSKSIAQIEGHVKQDDKPVVQAGSTSTDQNGYSNVTELRRGSTKCLPSHHSPEPALSDPHVGQACRGPMAQRGAFRSIEHPMH